jgi:uncharacterized protein (TIGR00730 family)
MNGNKMSEDIRYDDSEMLRSLSGDFARGCELLEGLGGCVEIIGSARFDEEHFYYKQALECARLISEAGLHITTGGSHGIMEAANRGALLGGGGESLGFNLRLPFEQDTNAYVTKSVILQNFNIRKQMLVRNAVAVVVFPGGFGTLDEIFDALTLVLTRKILPLRFYFYGSEYWGGLMEFIRTTLTRAGTITPSDADVMVLGDDVEEIRDNVIKDAFAYAQKMLDEGLESTPRYIALAAQLAKMER